MDTERKIHYFDLLTGLYSQSKTLRFSLEPLPCTKEWLDKKKAELREWERAWAYPVVKEVVDRFHRALIARVLETEEEHPTIDWETLGKLVWEAGHTASENGKKDSLKKEQEKIRKSIAEKLKADENYEELFGKKLFGKGGFLEKQELTEDERKAVEEYKNFSTALTAYQENRKNMYSDKDIGVSVANRIVNENFVTHVHNVAVFQQVAEEAPLLLEHLAELLKQQGIEFQKEMLFTYQGFERALSQTGIDDYNRVAGVFNGLVNEYRQGTEKEQGSVFQKQRSCMLRMLYKQILSVAQKRIAFQPYETDEEVLTDLNEMLCPEGELSVRTAAESMKVLFADGEGYNKAGIYLKADVLSEVSRLLGGGWDLLEKVLRLWYTEELSKKHTGAKLHDAVEEKMEQEYWTVAEIEQALSYYNDARKNDSGEKETDRDIMAELSQFCEEKCSALNETEKELKKFLGQGAENLSLKETDNTEIKAYLDACLGMVHFAKWFELDGSSGGFKEEEFYVVLNGILHDMEPVITIYNKVRSYVTKKPYREEKIALKFNNPTLAEGWSLSKEKDYGAVILRKEGQYYLGVFNASDKPHIQPEAVREEDGYEKMEYMLFKDISKMLPKCSTQRKEVKAHFAASEEVYVLDNKEFAKPLRITKEIFELNNVLYNGKKKWQKDYLKTGDEAGYREAVLKWNTFCMQFLTAYRSTADYDYSVLKPVEAYASVDELYHALDELLYKLSFVWVSAAQIAALEKKGQLFLFRIANRDFNPGRREGSKKNLHTLYWEALFSEENAASCVMKLNGGAELFFRPSSIKRPTIHKAGECLVNKRVEVTDATGETYYQPIPKEIYDQLKKYFNHRLPLEEMTPEAREFMAQHEIRTSVKQYDIVKDKRYTEDKYFLHVPMTINYRADEEKNLNLKVLKELQKCEGVNVIGLDRGERNLIAYAVVGEDGKMLEQGSFNVVEGMDYHEKLSQLEAERQKERRNWKRIENIKEMKQGYVSQVVHQVAQLMEKYNAIVVLEDLNYGFKKGRYKVEKQVYQKFETALVQKLSYMVTRKTEGQDMLQPGGVLNGYQLAKKPDSVKKTGRQCGAIFYVPAGYTSKIDPTTGFVDVFNYSRLSNRENRKAFFSRFEDISYDAARDCFAFQFDYNWFEVYQTLARTKWTVYTNETKHVYCREEKRNVRICVTEELKKLLEEAKINYREAGLKEKLLCVEADAEHAKFWERLEYFFRVAMQLRDSDSSEKVIDRIVSPVLNAKGEFFVTPEEPGVQNRYEETPMDADTNGAYHIAMKGLLLLSKKIRTAELGDKIPTDLLKLTNEEWFAYMQEEMRG